MGVTNEDLADQLSAYREATDRRVGALEVVVATQGKSLNELRDASRVLLAAHAFVTAKKTKIAGLLFFIAGSAGGPLVSALFKRLGWL